MTTSLGEMNDGARLWFYDRGLNTFPGVSKEKATYEDWDAYHHKPIPTEVFEQWIKEGKFLSGISVSPGTVYRIPELEGWYAVCIDWDKMEGFNALFPGKTVEEVAQTEYIEWHDDDKTRGHIWAYVPIVFPKKEPDRMFGLEVKGLNEHGVMVSFPSIHKNGYQYKPVGTDKFNRWDNEKAEILLNNIIKACNEQGIEYPKVKKTHSNSKRSYANNSQPRISVADFEEPIRVMLQSWPIEIDTSIEIPEGVRHEVLVFTANSILFRYSTTKNHNTLKEKFIEINYNLCKPEPSPPQEIERIWKDALEYAQANIEKEKVVPKEIAERLRQVGVYKVVKENPTTLYLADRQRDQIVKAIIMKPKNTVENDSKEDSEKKTKVETRTISKIKQLLIKDTMIDAIPTDVTIFNHPIDGSKTYKSMFRHRNANGTSHHIAVGPGTVSYLLNELKAKGRFVKGKESDEALTSLLIEWEDRGIAKIDNRMPQPGSYLIDGRIRGYDVTQRLLPGVKIGELEILACIDVLDELVTKYNNPDIGPTIIKHSIVSPYGYIKKGLKVSGDNWVPGIYEYGFTRVGKNTAGIIHLAIWRKHGIRDKEAHQLGFSGIDTPARFGNAISRSTYQIMISEVGSLVDVKYLWLSEMIKHSIESQTVRGKYIEGFFKGIPALSVPILTSNYLPPSDPAFKSRFILIHWGEKDLPTLEEKAAFKKWFFDERRDEILGILGDFTANYMMKYPEILNVHWEDISKRILIEFYKAAGREAPQWIDRLVEQDQIEAHVEEGKLKLRGFFVRVINEAYNAHIRTLTTKNEIILENGIVERFDFCIKHDLIPYIANHQSNRTADEIVITADVFDDLRRIKIESLTALKDLASMIGGKFESSTRKISGNNTKVAVGPTADFKSFLIRQIED